MQKISYVIPCYRSKQTIGAVVDEIQRTMSGQNNFTCEIILVNDCSPDNLWPVLLAIAEKNPNVICVDFAKNFGQHAALMAGYRYATGDIIISLDDDGQTPADESIKLVSKINEGYDVVYARYEQNKESTFRRFGSWMNLKMAEYMISKPKGVAIQSYFAAKRFIIEEIIKYEHAYPYIYGLVFRSTQNIGNVEVNHRSRLMGSSGYTMAKLIGLWMNGFTAFSVKPLRIASIIGTISAFFGFALGLWSIINKFLEPNIPVGYSSLISVVVFFGGLIMLMLGLVGEYIGRIYICLNHAPQYVIKDVVLGKEKDEKIDDVCKIKQR